MPPPQLLRSRCASRRCRCAMRSTSATGCSALYPAVRDHAARHHHAGRPRARQVARRRSAARACSSRKSRPRCATAAPTVAVHSLKDMPMEMAEGFTIAAVPDPRRSARHARVQPVPVDRGAARRRRRRHVEPAARGAAAREESDGSPCAPARQRQHARAQARRRPVRRDDPRGGRTQPARAESPHLGAARPRRFPARGGPGRARASNARSTAPTSSRPWRRSCTCRRCLAITAERAFSRTLSGSCHTPIAGYALFRDGELWLRGLLANREGTDILRGERSVALDAETGDNASRRCARPRAGARTSSRAAPRAS